MNTTAQLIGMCVAMVFDMLAFPLYDAVMKHGATCLPGGEFVLHLAINLLFVFSVVALLIVVRRCMRDI